MIDLQKAYNQLREHCNKVVPFSPEEFEMVLNLGDLRTLKKGEFIYKQGRIPAYGGFVYHGSLRHFYTDPNSGVETTVGFEFENSCFGDLRSIFYQEPAATSLQALEEVVIGTLKKEHYLFLVDIVNRSPR